MISNDLLVPLGLGLVVLVLGVVLIITMTTLGRERRQAAERLETSRVEAADLRERVDALARQMQNRSTPEEFVITDLTGTGPGAGPDQRSANQDDDGPQTAQRIEGRLFIDLVVRESVVKAASLTHGLRRALAPEARNRIRFEMKQETKRSRRQRRIEIRQVRREMAERQRTQEGAA